MDIVRFKGGLGNQMFQYAFVEALRSQGREVACNLGFYRNNPNAMPFVLNDIFYNVDLNEVDDRIFCEIDERWKKIKCCSEKMALFEKDLARRFFWVEKGHCLFDENIFLTQNCTFVGYWQTEKYFLNIRERILQCFEFLVKEKKLEKMSRNINLNDFVSVHVRRGDFLQIETHNVCTLTYYLNAIKYVKEMLDDVKFIFFSDDVEWIKQNFHEENMIICEAGMFDCYEDWYDMYLMTQCKGNIISNSSFSWWGAWLNKNQNKMVIAPKMWLKGIETPNIWCENWICL